MQYLHNARYGNPGGMHTARPQFVMKAGQIFKSEYHPDVQANREEGLKAQYTVRDNKAYQTSYHPGGESPHAVFEIKGDAVHTTLHHHDHDPAKPLFRIGGEKMDPTFIDNVIKNA